MPRLKRSWVVWLIGYPINNQGEEGCLVGLTGLAEYPPQMNTALTAQGNLPLIACKPAVSSVGLPGAQTAIGLAKTENNELDAVRIGDTMAVLTIHLDTAIFMADDMVARTAVNC